ncbi:hypothetical protein yc1106_03376 [Curvularia clavata]|uniref:Uncharacterized protein n=1 Tax=Curvularia clavata TaxID=95742 RepID=A0A9Q9DQZ6_CURCL|nr:hypothetical protein yc1106_03376 [Curvularia clavata]
MSLAAQSKILLPLYIYPHPGAWEPLYTAGPGTPPWWPNADYVREIARLNALSNVTTLGYVRATYCKRPHGDICEDIKVYAARGREDEKMRVEGVFVDETVNLYDERVKRYLDGVDERVRCELPCTEKGKGMVIHNPGTAVNAGLAKPGPDITVVVETSYQHFVTKDYQEWLATSPYDRSRAAYMVHSVPEHEVEGLTRALKKRAEYLFVTSATTGFYEKFGPSWVRFVQVMAEP